MADKRPGAIQRNLESAGNLFINKFWTGLYQNRSELYTPVSALGVQLISRQDALWDGLNFMVTPQFTLRRRYGFSKACSAAFGGGEMPLDFTSYEDLQGTIRSIVDTQYGVYLFSANGKGLLRGKGLDGAQASFNSVGDTLYWCDGTASYKFIGPNLLTNSNTLSSWALADATVVAGFADPFGGTNAWQVSLANASGNAFISLGVTLTYTLLASNTFTFSVWAKQSAPGQVLQLQTDGNVGSIQGINFNLTSTWQRCSFTLTMNPADTTVRVAIVNGLVSGAMSPFIYAPQFEVGTVTTPAEITTTLAQGVYLMGIVAPITGPTLSYTASGSLAPTTGYKYGYVFKNPITDHPSTMSPASPSTGPLANNTVVEKHTIPASGPFTITVTNGATMLADGGVVADPTSAPFKSVVSGPGSGQYIPGVAGVGTYTFSAANAGNVIDITYTYSLVASTGVNIVVTVDGSGDPQVGYIDVYRTADGGAIFFYLATVANPGQGNTTTYTDSTPDSGLNTEIIAPVSGVNAPPAAGMSLLVWFAGRLWGASGNTLYFSGGPDTLNGVGEEAWPAINNFTVQGNITALTATSQGLIIWTRDNSFVTLSLGTNPNTFTAPNIWQQNLGVANQNCVAQDGDTLFFMTTRSQVWTYGAGGLQEIGFLEEGQLGAFTPANCYVSIHRNGPDEGIFVADGSSKIYRYSQVSNAWDTVIMPVGGCGAIASIELQDGAWHLLMGRATGSGFILQRDLSVYTDDGSTYPLWATIGSITVAPPRQVAVLASILLWARAVGTYPTIQVMNNEITDLGVLPATFTTLPNPQPDPPQLANSKTVWMKRHDFKAAQTPLPQRVNHLQIKIVFPSEAQPNEVMGLGIAAND